MPPSYRPAPRRDWKDRTFRPVALPRLDGHRARAKSAGVTLATASAAPTFSLARFFEAPRLKVPPAGRTLRVEWLPDGRTQIVFRVLDEGRRGELSILGPRMRAMFK